MEGDMTVEVRVFNTLRRHIGVSTPSWPLRVPIELEGSTGLLIASQLGIPTKLIEGIFVNGKVRGLKETVMPGDRLAFIPYGTPGPYRIFLGMVDPETGRSRLLGDTEDAKSEPGR